MEYFNLLPFANGKGFAAAYPSLNGKSCWWLYLTYEGELVDIKCTNHLGQTIQLQNL